MPIEFVCQSCQATLRVPDEAQGKSIRCPNCGSITSGATPSSTPPPSSLFPPTKPQPDFSQPSYDQQQPSYPMANQGYDPYQGPATYYGQSPLPPRHVVVNRILPASIVWMVFVSLNLVFCVLGLLQGGVEMSMMGVLPETLFGFIIILTLLGLSVIGILGSVAMLNMRYYAFSIIGTIATFCSGIACCFLPSALVIWPFVILLLPGTREYFH